MQETVLELSARGGRIAAGDGLFAGGPFAAGLIAGGLFASGLNAATPCVTVGHAVSHIHRSLASTGRRNVGMPKCVTCRGSIIVHIQEKNKGINHPCVSSKLGYLE